MGNYTLLGFMFLLIAGFILTILIETGVAWLLKYRRKEEIQIVILASVVTYPVLQFILAIPFSFTGGSTSFIFIPFLEVLVVIAEYYILSYVFGNKYTSKQLLLLSFTMNAASYLIGLLIF